MKQFLGAIAVGKVAEIASKTDTVVGIIDHAADSAERVADFLEDIVEGLEEESDDLSMQ